MPLVSSYGKVEQIIEYELKIDNLLSLVLTFPS
jgi:hypothetical protein